MTNILDLPMEENDAGAKTIRHYFQLMMVKLWLKGEGFSGKRPFGNSGWEFEIYETLIKAGYVNGTLDSDGLVDGFDSEEMKLADKLIEQALLEDANNVKSTPYHLPSPQYELVKQVVDGVEVEPVLTELRPCGCYVVPNNLCPLHEERGR